MYLFTHIPCCSRDRVSVLHLDINPDSDATIFHPRVSHSMPPLPFRATFKLISATETASISLFRTHHFSPGIPFVFPRTAFETSIPAIHKWFEPIQSPAPAGSAVRIKENYLLPLSDDVSVTVEVTTQDGSQRATFERTLMPLSVVLRHLQAHTSSESRGSTSTPPRLYVAQHSLADLPAALQRDVPAPEVVRGAGRGDVYGSSLWMGVAPTHTPLHKDPNPNLFVQMAGTKAVRLLPPEAGLRLFAAARESLARTSALDRDWDGGWLGRGGGLVGGLGSSMRGEDMMVGEEGRLTEEVVWETNDDAESVEDIQGSEAILGPGDGIFIPKGWWHSIKGIGCGLNASVGSVHDAYPQWVAISC